MSSAVYIAVSLTVSIVLFLILSVVIHHWVVKRRLARASTPVAATRDRTIVPGTFGSNIHTLNQPETVGKPIYTS